jgi:protein involved in polysaccharide export with SLBB domain
VAAGTVSRNLKQFGYDVFSKLITTFAPVTNVPVGADYVIGPGDAFTLTMWGRADGPSKNGSLRKIRLLLISYLFSVVSNQ